ncbi:MAG: nicotinate phosphoribosyltransferase, partial [Desulfurococcales archaeon]|nr:nicotinate phosphoribosyltransferase [Desulfurococcales archaeon]
MTEEQRSPRLYAAMPDEIVSGFITDVYFERTKRIIESKGLENVRVRMEIHVYNLPKGYDWAVFAGLEEALAILEGKPVDVYSIPEGTVFGPKEPLMMIEGRYVDFGVLETALLGVLRFSTSIATKAARVKLVAGDKTVLYFGLRALHPAVAPAADRAAYIGGVDGVSGLASRKYLGVEPRGTMPHALIILFGDQVEAWKAFRDVVGNEAPVIALVDTFWDEREEALLAARELGEDLVGVRLDTPSSRRGK